MDVRAAHPVVDGSDTAFGSNPGLWPLPPATTAPGLWVRAVAAGGQGRYGSALADLDRLRRLDAPARLASLAASTRASFLRQLGWHERARPLDGDAFALAGDDAEAAADALIGLAADALGVGRFSASARALQRSADPVARCGVARLAVRHAWVSAELAMVRGEGAAAVGHAASAAELAEGLGSVRHVVKSQVILAAARCSSGEPAAARRAAETALTEAGEHGLIPLRWAAACLLADIGSADFSPPEIAAVRDEAAEIVIKRGGVWRRR